MRLCGHSIIKVVSLVCDQIELSYMSIHFVQAHNFSSVWILFVQTMCSWLCRRNACSKKTCSSRWTLNPGACLSCLLRAMRFKGIVRTLWLMRFTEHTSSFRGPCYDIIECSRCHCQKFNCSFCAPAKWMLILRIGAQNMVAMTCLKHLQYAKMWPLILVSIALLMLTLRGHQVYQIDWFVISKQRCLFILL